MNRFIWKEGDFEIKPPHEATKVGVKRGAVKKLGEALLHVMNGAGNGSFVDLLDLLAEGGPGSGHFGHKGRKNAGAAASLAALVSRSRSRSG